MNAAATYMLLWVRGQLSCMPIPESLFHPIRPIWPIISKTFLERNTVSLHAVATEGHRSTPRSDIDASGGGSEPGIGDPQVSAELLSHQIALSDRCTCSAISAAQSSTQCPVPVFKEVPAKQTL